MDVTSPPEGPTEGPGAERLARALLILRVSLGVFMLLWAVEKLVRPGASAQIWSSFYGIGLPESLSPVVGIAEIVLVLAFLAGLWRRLTYGAVLLLNVISVGSTWSQLIHPWEGSNHLFLAGIPVVGACVVLYLLREHDAWSVDAIRRSPRGDAS